MELWENWKIELHIHKCIMEMTHFIEMMRTLTLSLVPPNEIWDGTVGQNEIWDGTVGQNEIWDGTVGQNEIWDRTVGQGMVEVIPLLWVVVCMKYMHI